jgi:glycosyltransferase involved in cell wall biosynthesis
VKIGFLHKVNTTPPKSGGSVHTYQVSQYLARRGYQLLTLDNEQGAQFAQHFPRSWAGLKALVNSADLLYFRIDGRTGWELLSLVPGLVNAKKPIVWEVNATLEELNVLPEPKRWIDQGGPVLRSLSARKASAALCVSEPLVRYAQDMEINHCHLIPNGSDPEMFCPKWRDPLTYPEVTDKFRVLWAGSTDYGWHDFETVLNSAACLQSLDPNISFIVIGKRPHLPSVNIPDNVYFYPPVPYLDVPRYFASADVGLCIYQNVSWSKYGFFFSPLKLFDYAASGLPVIYTDFPELDRVANKFGVKVAAEDAEGLTQQILQLKQQTSLRQRLAHQARQSVLEFYNWNRVGLQTEQVLQSLVQQPLSQSTQALLIANR